MRGLLVMASVLAAAGCGDPSRDAIIEALGDEAAGFEPSELHRPGQPCVLCHSPYFGAEPELSIGGTLFSPPSGDEAPFMVAGYTVRIIDSDGQRRDLVTNRCGNFSIPRDQWDPAFPLRAELYAPLDPEKPSELAQVAVMASRIGRDGSCAGCHVHPKSPLSPGVVYAPNLPATFTPPADCPPPWLGPNPKAPALQ